MQASTLLRNKSRPKHGAQEALRFAEPNGHGDIATPDNEARHARFPLSISLHPQGVRRWVPRCFAATQLLPQTGERVEVSLREIHVKSQRVSMRYPYFTDI